MELLGKLREEQKQDVFWFVFNNVRHYGYNTHFSAGTNEQGKKIKYTKIQSQPLEGCADHQCTQYSSFYHDSKEYWTKPDYKIEKDKCTDNFNYKRWDEYSLLEKIWNVSLLKELWDEKSQGKSLGKAQGWHMQLTSHDDVCKLDMSRFVTENEELDKNKVYRSFNTRPEIVEDAVVHEAFRAIITRCTKLKVDNNTFEILPPAMKATLAIQSSIKDSHSAIFQLPEKW